MTPDPPATADPVVGRAPGRVNLIGEHVDYNGGRCLPFALTRTTTATLRRRDDGLLRVRSDDRAWEGRADALQDAPTWVRYVAGVLVTLQVDVGFDIEITSDVPLGAGLSSSAALECSVAVALDAALGLGLGPAELVEACVRAESEVVGAPTGGLDQEIAVHGEDSHALLLDFATGEREQVPCDPTGSGLEVLVIDTRVSHELVDGGYASRRDEAWEAARQLGLRHLAEADLGSLAVLAEPLRRRARHVVSETARVGQVVEALRAGDWSAVGPVLDASHASLRDDYEVSCVELDRACETAREAGATGARMIGGGFGGSAIALVPAARVEAVEAAVTVAFTAAGWRRPDFFVARPGPGAHVVR